MIRSELISLLNGLEVDMEVYIRNFPDLIIVAYAHSYYEAPVYCIGFYEKFIIKFHLQSQNQKTYTAKVIGETRKEFERFQISLQSSALRWTIL